MKKKFITTYNYEDFLEELHLITNLEPKILDNLYKLSALHIILLNYENEYESETIQFLDYFSKKFIISPFLKIVDNFKENTNYILASYLVFNNNFKIDEKNEEPFFNNIFLQVKSNHIECCFLYNLHESVPYEISLLSEEETLLLSNNIMSQHVSCKYSGLYKSTYTINFPIYINYSDSINTIFLNIDKQIQQSQIEYNNIVRNFREDNKKFFERSLLEQQIEKF